MRRVSPAVAIGESICGKWVIQFLLLRIDSFCIATCLEQRCYTGTFMARLSRQAATKRVKPKETGLIDFVVGERLRDLRIERDISQRDLGQRIGVTFQQVQKYERGMNRITVARLAEICKSLNVGFDYFLTGADQNAGAGLAESGASPLAPGLSDEERAMLKAFRRVSSARRRKTILGLIKEMAEQLDD
ncbi:MAG: helix-turn-helix transcriptional regulator [Hyphomicrobiaceae bacterium]